MFKLLKIVLGVLLVALLWGPAKVQAAAGINHQINFQGKVVNKGVGATDGTNVPDGNYNFTFSIWNALSAGSSLWTETWNAGTSQVPVTNGIFNVALGTYTSLPGGVDFNTNNLFLGVNFNGDGEMSPRIQFTAVPYAMNADRVGGAVVTGAGATLALPTGKSVTFGDNFTTASGIGISLNQSLSTGDSVAFANISIGGTVVFSNLPVGVGTTVMYVGAGGVLVQGTLPPGGQTYTASNGLNLAGSAFGLGGTLAQNTNIGVSSFGLSFLGAGNSQPFYIGRLGVGVGTTNPQYQLDVSGNLNLSGTVFAAGTTGANGQVLTSNGSGGLTWTTPSGQTYYANNGLTMTGTTMGLGGSLTQASQIGTSSFGLSFVGLGGSQALYITSNGKVGVGTSSPSYGFNVNGEVVATKFGVGGTDSTFNLFINTGGIGVTGNSVFTNNLTVGGSVTFTGVPVAVGTSVLYISNSGVLTQGTLPPGAAVTVTNGLSLYSGSVGLGGTMTTNTSVGVSSFSFSFTGLGSSQVFYVSSAGTVGIGTTGMGHEFDVVGTGSTGYVAGVYNNNTDPNASGVYMESDGGGNILDLNNAGSDVLSVSPAQSTINNPLNVTAAGDVGIAYDLYFTNQTAANIRSYGPLSLESGEAFESNDLTLRTFNAGNVVFDVGGSGEVMIGTGVGKTTPVLLVLDNGSTDPLGTNGALYYSTASNKLRCFENGAWTNCVASSVGTTGSSMQIVLSPEYAGASLSKDDSSTNDGSMTSDDSLTGTNSWRNYYQWTSTNAALQDYSVIVRVTLPNDFGSWQTGSCPGSTCALEVAYQTGVGSTASNYVSFRVNSDTDTPGTAICTVAGVGSTAWTSTGCASTVLQSGTAPQWYSAGQSAVIRVKLAANNTASALARVGDIILRYKSSKY